MQLESGTVPRPPRLWAVGSGKGGVGKSVVTASLAIELARRGKKCVILDADLGGANQHTLLGMANPTVSLADLLCRRVSSLQEILLPTPIPNLRLLSGARALLEMANLKHLQKEKIIRQLQTLPADHVLIDLGAGSSFNVLDFFLAANQMMVVVTPLPTAIENANHLLKAIFYRRLRKAIQRAGAGRLVDQVMEEKVARGIRSPRDLLVQVTRMDAGKGAAIGREIGACAPKLIVNQVHSEEEAGLGKQMAVAYTEYFGVRAEFLGAIWNDDRVRSAVKMKRPAIEAFPQSPFAQAIGEIAGRQLDAEEASDV